MTARRGHQGRRARLHGRGPPLTSPRRRGRRRRRPSGRSAPPAKEEEKAKGAARRASQMRAARGPPPGARRRGKGPGAPGAGVSLAPSHPWRSLAAAPSLLLRASGRPRACAHASVPAKRPAFRRFTPARGQCRRAPFFLPPRQSVWANNRREGTGFLPIVGRVGGAGGGKGLGNLERGNGEEEGLEDQ